MTRQVEALIAGTYLSGTNTRRVRRALGALFKGAVGKDVVSRTWRFAARSTIRAIMSGDSGPPRSETNTNGEVLPTFSFRSADTSSRSRVCTLSFEPFKRRTWKVCGPDPGARSKSVHLVCLASEARRPCRYIKPKQHLIAQLLPARSTGRADHRVGLVGAEVVARNMRIFVSRTPFAHSCNPLLYLIIAYR